MTTMGSKMLVAAVTTAALAVGATTAKADHYVRSCGNSYASYAPAYYPQVYAPAPVVYAAPAYAYAPYQPVTYVYEPVYYPRYYAPAPVYRSYYAPAQYGFGFGYSNGGYGGYGGYRGHGGGFSISGGHRRH